MRGDDLIAARRALGPLRVRADCWSLAYLGLTTALLVWHWHLDAIHPSLVVLACVLTYGCGCIQHDQAHLPMWSSRWLNALTEAWIQVLRGDGVWSWVPTHVGNHHRYANRPGDLTLTWRCGRGNHLGNAILYTFCGCALYGLAVLRYLGSALRQRPRRAAGILALIALHAAVLTYALHLDVQRTLLLLVLPQAVGIVAMIATGFCQHHHTRTGSAWDHSRNFTGRLLNLVCFNHGYHTVHHVDRRLHWSEWPAAHARCRDRIDPSLNESSLGWYLLRTFVLAPLAPRWRSRDHGTVPLISRAHP